MKDWYDLLLMILNDLVNVYLPIGLFVGLTYLLKTEPWRLYIGIIIVMFLSNIIKWKWKK